MSSNPRQTRVPPTEPPRYKRAVLTYLGLLLPVYLIPPVVAAWLPGHPFLVVVVAVAIIVVLMTYLIMPVLQRVFAPWLRG